MLARNNLVLAALAAGQGAAFTPVQIQKLLFLIDKQIPDLVHGPHFRFEPYHYGPFDAEVYSALESLEEDGKVDITRGGSWRTYRPTAEGLMEGGSVLGSLSPKAQQFLLRAAEFVQTLSFSELVSAIYEAFPEMRRNSVFQE